MTIAGPAAELVLLMLEHKEQLDTIQIGIQGIKHGQVNHNPMTEVCMVL